MWGHKQPFGYVFQATVSLAKGFSVVCAFINDVINEEVLKELDKLGIRQVALRCAGFNNVDCMRSAALTSTDSRRCLSASPSCCLCVCVCV